MLATIDRESVRNSFVVKTETRVPRLLCVDDDPELQTMLELRLRNYAIEVEHAYYGMQGITEALRSRPDAILMDLAMPNGNGEYLLDCVKRNSAICDIPVVVLTGMRDPQLRKTMINAGASAFLTKPVAFDELLHTLGRFMELSRTNAST